MDMLKIGTEVITGASILHTVLPPWETFDQFPTVQKYYKVFVYFVGYVALNGRSTLYTSLSTQSGSQPSDVAVKTVAQQTNQWKPTGSK